MPRRPRSQSKETQQPTVCHPWPTGRRVAEAVQKVGHHLSVVRGGSRALWQGARHAHSKVVL